MHLVASICGLLVRQKGKKRANFFTFRPIMIVAGRFSNRAPVEVKIETVRLRRQFSLLY